MSLSEETLLDLIERGEVEACTRFFDGASEQERGTLAKVAVREYRARWGQWEEPRPSPESVQAAKVATLATARLSDFRRLSGMLWLDEPGERELIASRPPALIQSLVDLLVEDNPRSARFVVEMMRDGLCAKPAHENFLLGLMERWGHTRAEDGGLVGALRSEPEFLAGDLWRLLETEGGGEWSLSAHDKYRTDSGRWDVALVALSDEGLIPRARLLDVTLEVLARDFAQFRSSWYSRLHESLSPTVEEGQERVQGYCGLLASTIPPTVSFALKALAALDKAAALDPDNLLAQIEPALLSKAKSSANLALRLVSKAAPRSEDPIIGARVAARALAHEAADVQDRALSLLERLDALGDPHVRETIQDLREVVAPSTRRRLDEIAPLDGHGETSDEVEPVAVESVARSVEPVKHLDDLLLRFSHVLENPDAVEDVEQVLGGLALLCAERPTDWERRVGPLAKRAAALRESEDFIQHDLACLALCWVNGTKFDPHLPLTLAADEAPCTAELFRVRVRKLSERVRKGSAAPLLSCPTQPRGWVDPSVVVARENRLGEARLQPDDADMVLALLRLANDGRAEALGRASHIRGEFGEALRYALGSDRVKVGRSAHLWIAAARARDPNSDHPLVARKHKNLGPDGASVARYNLEIEEFLPEYKYFRVLLQREPPVPKRLRPLHPTVLFHSGRRGRYPGLRGAGACGFQLGLVRWSALIAPGGLEGYFSVAVERIDLDWSEVQWEVRSFFEPMLEPDVPLGPIALLLLALGLGAKEPGQHGIAVDVLVTAAEEARLDVDHLGKWMGQLLPSGLIKARRWAQTLLQAAQAGPEPARVVRTLLQASLRGEPSQAPRDLSYLLDALNELLIEAKIGLSDSEAREYLEHLSTGGKTGRLRRSILAL